MIREQTNGGPGSLRSASNGHCAAPSRKWRIALYSPGMVGIGHMRRNLLIAQTLAEAPLRAVILMIAEAREANVLSLPAGGDCLTLPALQKEFDGRCKPRCLDASLEEVVGLRAKVIGAALEGFEPDVLIVDHLPRGALRELDGALEALRARGRTRCILGLRDVLEDPERVRAEWARWDNEEAICEYYDAVWIYGDPAVYDPVREYRFCARVAAKVHYTGYLDCRMRPRFAEGEGSALLSALTRTQPLVLCMVGGGQDGANLAEAFAQADYPRGALGVILMGPFMPPEVQSRLRRRAAQRPDLRVLEFIPCPELLLRHAQRVIAMGGYNTIYEVLSFEKHALIVPRSKPRHEQQIRAERLRDLGLLDVLAPDRVTSGALSTWLARDLGQPRRVRDHLDMKGTVRLPVLLEELLGRGLDRTPSPPGERRLLYAAT